MVVDRGLSGFSKEAYLSRFRNAFYGYTEFCDFIFGTIEGGDSEHAHKLIAKNIRELADSVGVSSASAIPRWYEHPIGWTFASLDFDVNNVLSAIQATLHIARETLSPGINEGGLCEIDRSFTRLTASGGEYESSLKGLYRVQNLLTKRTLNYYADEIVKDLDSSPITTVRELFDIWIVSAETVNAHALESSSYVTEYSGFVSTACRFKEELDTLQRLTMNSISEGLLREVNEKGTSIKLKTSEQ